MHNKFVYDRQFLLSIKPLTDLLRRFFGFTQMVCAKVKIISNGFSDYFTRAIVKLPLDNTHVLPVYNGGHYWWRRLTRCCSPYLWTIQKKIVVGTARKAALFHHSTPLLAHGEPATSTHGEPATSTQAELTRLWWKTFNQLKRWSPITSVFSFSYSLNHLLFVEYFILLQYEIFLF